MSRGELTEEVNKIAEKHLGRKIDRTELRLIPYIQYIMVNEQKIGPNKINSEERKIYQNWKKEGHVEGGMCGLSVTKEFWDFMCDILFESYVKDAYP